MFQEALIESLPQRSWRLRTILTSASLHALALGPLRLAVNVEFALH
jgi:hypothetical protein